MMEENEDKNTAAEKASEAAFEYQISNETRDFLKGINTQGVRKLTARPLYIAGIAASFIILIASVITINLSHNNSSIAKKYGINSLVARTGSNVSNDEFREAVQFYYAKEYDSASEILDTLPVSDSRLADFADWLRLLIELQTAGSESSTFSVVLQSIISDEDHEFHEQALKLKEDVDLFWRSFVVKK